MGVLLENPRLLRPVLEVLTCTCFRPRLEFSFSDVCAVITDQDLVLPVPVLRIRSAGPHLLYELFTKLHSEPRFLTWGLDLGLSRTGLVLLLNYHLVKWWLLHSLEELVHVLREYLVAAPPLTLSIRIGYTRSEPVRELFWTSLYEVLKVLRSVARRFPRVEVCAVPENLTHQHWGPEMQLSQLPEDVVDAVRIAYYRTPRHLYVTEHSYP